MTTKHSIEKVILFNDIIGSTKQWNKYGNRMFKEIERVTTIVNNLLKKTNGVFSSDISNILLVAGWFLLVTVVALIVTQ